MSNIQQPNPRWPPFYRKIEKKVTNYELIYLEWQFWCPNVGLLAQGLTSRQQETCMSNIQQPNPRWPTFYLKNKKIAMKYELLVIDLEWWFWCPNVGLLSQGLTSRQKKYLMAKSKMATISYENIPKRMMVLASKSGIRPSSDTMILLVIFSILGTSHPLVYQLVLTY